MKKKSSSHPFWTAMVWFLGIVCVAMIGGMAYVLMMLVIDLVESSNIKMEMSNVLTSYSPTDHEIILSTTIMTIILMVSSLIYIVYTIKTCKQQSTRVVCRVRLSLKIAFLTMTTMGMAWAIYLHLHNSHTTIYRWQKMLLVVLLLPIVVVFSGIFLFLFGQMASGIPIYAYSWP